MSLNSISKELLVLDEIGIRGRKSSATDKAIDALSKFIPTEMLAPYVAALSLIATKAVTWNELRVYWIFIIATPATFLLFHFAKIAMDQDNPMPKKADIPKLIWKAIAAAVAFAVWAIAVPTNGLQEAIGGAAVASFLAIVISPILTALDAILVRVLKWK